MAQIPDKHTPGELANFAANHAAAAADAENSRPSQGSSIQTSTDINPAMTNLSWTSKGSTQVAATRMSHITEQMREKRRGTSSDSDDEDHERAPEHLPVPSQRQPSEDDRKPSLESIVETSLTEPK